MIPSLQMCKELLIVRFPGKENLPKIACHASEDCGVHRDHPPLKIGGRTEQYLTLTMQPTVRRWENRPLYQLLPPNSRRSGYPLRVDTHLISRGTGSGADTWRRLIRQHLRGPHRSNRMDLLTNFLRFNTVRSKMRDFRSGLKLISTLVSGWLWVKIQIFRRPVRAGHLELDPTLWQGSLAWSNRSFPCNVGTVQAK